MQRDTIYALATPTPTRAQPGAIAVIRLSGARADEALYRAKSAGRNQVCE